MSKRFQRTQLPRKGTTNKRRIHKPEFKRALKGTAGVKSTIARNLDCSIMTVYALLDRPGWEDIRQAYNEEVERGIDNAEIAIQDAITQRLDIGTATLNARWLLSRLRRARYGDETKHIHEGGTNPIRTMNIHVDISKLNLPIEVQRIILAALDAEEEKAKQRLLTAQSTAGGLNGMVDGAIVSDREEESA